MSRYFAQIENGQVTRVIVANNIEWCQSRLGGEWIETRDPYAETQANPELEPVNYCGPGFGCDPTFPERFAPQWVQPAPDPETGEWLSYPKGRVVAHNGQLWKSTTDGNVWEPGISAWHNEPEIEGVDPIWIQPTGTHDTYPLDFIVTHNDKRWKSTNAANVWEPGVAEWVEVDEAGDPIQPPVSELPERWVQPTGGHDAYAIDDLVVWDRPQDGGQDWVFRSTFAGNTTEPGRDGTFDRYWEPLSRAEDWGGV